eukprot:CAMPEP_0196574172 /NCGR_PEP_ID=MMETSP1081-20130531/3944_1 /TAXON_ID=36882 /ORGANISM="Pyramimonas amylifera, Strain CCMP720" /LENGTH=447 /DNA_ID=CAMNT_0041892117 /DNA_START=238 /DNA_END=1581 /DNA_ORIENTATION=-
MSKSIILIRNESKIGSIYVAPHPITKHVPPQLVSVEQGTWAYDTMSRRIREDILSRVFSENELSLKHLTALQALDLELQSAATEKLRYIKGGSRCPDIETWTDLLAEHVQAGRTWLQAPWLTAEFYFYRRIMEAVEYFESGIDPFQLQKDAGLTSAEAPIRSLTAQLAAATSSPDRLTDQTDEEAAAMLELFVVTALWGNRMDLSLWPATSDSSRAATAFEEAIAAGESQLLASDISVVVKELMCARAEGGRRMDIVVDNAGFELLCDLCLADVLLETGAASKVVLQLKGHPTFVSDALSKDVVATVEYVDSLSETPGSSEVGRRWARHLARGKWVLNEDLYWAQPQPFWDMPQEVTEDLRRSAMVFVKGDANYRRLLGDCQWPLSTPFSQVAGYFPAPLCALRTLKAEVGCGMAAEKVEMASAADKQWLTDGKWGVIQYFKSPSPI